MFNLKKDSKIRFYVYLLNDKIECSFCREVLFDNISLQVDERDPAGLPWSRKKRMEPRLESTFLENLGGRRKADFWEINSGTFSLLFVGWPLVINTIYDEITHVFDDLRKTEKACVKMELAMGKKTGADLEKLMQDLHRPSEESVQPVALPYEADIRAILNGFKFDESMWQMKIEELLQGKIPNLCSGQDVLKTKLLR